MTDQKPLLLYSHFGGPNPWKVAMILEELAVPYKTKFVEFSDAKKEPLVLLNPNGRLPILEDPNHNVALWESGAIIDYIIDVYDKDAKLHYHTSPEKYLTRTWAYFQMSGQGPYFGQLIWFNRYHPEKIQSAQDRYADEVTRVTGVIDRHLKMQKTDYLVGHKVTYADLMFVMWAVIIHNEVGTLVDLSEFDAYHSWLGRLMSRPTVEKILKERAGMLS